MSSNNSLRVLRSVFHEVRANFPPNTKLRDLPLFEYILQQYRANAVTDLKFCREKDELLFMAKTYALYMKSRKSLKDIYNEYHAKGEKSVNETAKMVGFKLPSDPR